MKSWISSRKKNLCNIHVFIVTFDAFITPLLNKSITFLSLTDFKLLNRSVCNKESLHIAIGKTIMIVFWRQSEDW